MRFQDAVSFAYSKDWPLTTAITVSWDALKQAGERNEGHCLGMASWDRERYLRKELARLCRSRGLPFAAIWGRDVGRVIGAHVHLSLFYPSWRLAELVTLIELLTGSLADFVQTPYVAPLVARSVCGGWRIDMNCRDKEGALSWADYICEQHDKHPDIPELKGKAFGVSVAIGHAAQKRAGWGEY